MPRFRLSTLKTALMVVLALIGLISSVEVGMIIASIYQPACESRNGPCPLGFVQSELLEGSWTCHHRLKPLQKVLSAAPGGSAVPVRTNSFGLRGGEITTPKPPRRLRILVLGDESIFAAEVDEKDTSCERLRTLLQLQFGEEVEVLNGGIPGFCPLLSYLHYHHALRGLEPDVVIAHFDMSDVSDDHTVRPFTLQHDGAPAACPHPNLTAVRKSPLHGWDRLRTVQWFREKVTEFTEEEAPRDDTEDIDSRQGRYAWLRDRPPDWSVYIEQSLQPLLLLQDAVRRHGGQLIVATSPAPWQVSSQASAGRGVRESAGVPLNSHFQSRRPFEVLAGWCETNGLPLIDTSPAFQNAEQPAVYFLKHAPRFSPLGHELFARELAAGVQRLLSAGPGAEPWPSESMPVPPRQADRGTPDRG